MPAVRIVPWEHPSDLVKLGHLFFRGAELNRSTKSLREACNTVTAWQHRGAVPHAIAATAGLVDAILLDQSPSPPSAAVLVSAYSAAFSAFVTGYLDVQQTGAAKRSMHDLAAELAMPRAFVGVRHAVTHEGGAGASLRELRRVARAGLAWVHEQYWRGLLQQRRGAGEAAQEEARRLLGEYAAAKREATGPRVLDPGRRLRAGLAAEACAALVKTGAGAAALADEVLSERCLLAGKTAVYVPDDESLRVWDPLLRALAADAPGFVGAFVERAVGGRLAAASHSGKLARAESEACLTVVAWLVHVFGPAGWADSVPAQERVSAEQVAEACEACPGSYAELVLALLRPPRERPRLDDAQAHDFFAKLAGGQFADTNSTWCWVQAETGQLGNQAADEEMQAV